MFFDLTFTNYNYAHRINDNPTLNDDFSEHFHKVYELLYIVDGEGELTVGDEVIPISGGDCALIMPNQKHHISFKSDAPYERYIIKFPSYALPRKLKPLIAAHSTRFDVKNSMLPALFERLDYHIGAYEGVDLSGLLKCALFEILYYICRDSSDDVPQVQDENISEIVDFINENIARRITLADICDSFHYSQSYICKEFLTVMNMPIMQYIRTKKVLLADKLIRSGIKPVDVYYQCGFADYSTFYRAYKKIFGHQPSLSEGDGSISVSPVEIDDPDLDFFNSL